MEEILFSSRWERNLIQEKKRIALFLVVFIVCLYLISRWWKNRRYWFLASKIPGPPAYPIIGAIHMFAGVSLAEVFRLIKQLHKQYGSVIKIWGGPKLIVFISDPESIERTVANRKFENRGGYVYRVAKPLFKNGLLLSRGEIWRSHRKLVSSAFHNNILESFVSNFAKNGNLLVNNLIKKANGTTFNLYPFTFNCALDIIIETTSGMALNAQSEEKGPYANYMLKCLEIMMQRFKKPWLIIDWISNLTALGQEQKAVMKAIDKLIYGGIQEKLDNLQQKHNKIDLEDKECIKNKNLCLIDLFIETRMMNEEEIRDEAASIIGAGSETTSTTVCYVLSLLGVHQEIQDKVMQEQKDIFHDDIFRPATSSDIKEMVYLEKVIKESLRIFPPVPWVFRAITEDTKIAQGLTIPKGTYCIVNAYDMHRNPKYFPGPGRFDPERFSPENIADRHPYAYLPFGAGRRFCVGFQYAMMETKTILSTLLRHYEVTYVPGGIEGLEKKLEVGLVLKPYDGFPIQLMPREYAKVSS